MLEQRAGRPRSDAWKHFAERTDVEQVRNLVSVLVQSEQFGTSIAKTLRVHSDTLRTQRRQQVEEQAAKTTRQARLPACFVYLSFTVCRGSWARHYYDRSRSKRISLTKRKEAMKWTI